MGDNFSMDNFCQKLYQCTKLGNGAKIVLHKVINPEQFGVAN